MKQNGLIGDREYAAAAEAPLTVARGYSSVEAPYFADMVNDALQAKFQDVDFQSNAYRIYTTIDMRLQRAATEAVRAGMTGVDAQIRRQARFKGQTPPVPQVALMALDPHTGEIKAVVGGRNYGVGQLNHVLASRQPGSIFNPFVYAAALNTGVNSSTSLITAASTVTDEPKTHGKKSIGAVSLRYAMAHSLNVPTVKFAEKTGFDAIVEMARRAGMNNRIRPTPAVALGSYDITPMEAAGAYTIFATVACT
jgi:penicillin-binding protein 1B